MDIEKKFGDKELICIECNKNFISTEAEQEFSARADRFDSSKDRTNMCPECRSKVYRSDMIEDLNKIKEVVESVLGAKEADVELVSIQK